ncbi:MAG: ATP-binding protein [Solidesulfovibrio sp. DCME]|uniref:ATP-binding protein n=1 Tax=Solidesulfovibrio sp. DCME TaxID=3447380 RepID=UPI003D097202
MPQPASAKKFLSGPALVVCIAAILTVCSLEGITIPNPVLFFSLAIVLSSFVGGTASGLTSVGVTLAFLLFYWSKPGEFLAYRGQDIIRFVVFLATMPAMAVLVGLLERKNRLRIAEIETQARELADSRRRLARAERVAGMGNWEVDIDTATLFASQGAQRIYGIGEGPYSLLDVQHIPLPPYRRALNEALRNLLTHRSEYDLTFKIRRPTDGAIIDIHSRAVFDAAARKVFGTIQDVTTHKAIEAALIESTTRAEAANKAKSAFLANMSHEIRTPLNGILGTLQALEDTVLVEEQRNLLAAAMRASKRLAQLLSDILDLSRIESGKMPVFTDRFEPGALVTAIDDIFQGAARQAGLSLRCQVAPGLPRTLIGDEMRIRQILFNLVGNAIKFTGQGGITVSIDPLGRHGHDIRVLFTVSDSGPGIPDAFLEQLCEPFTQAADLAAHCHQGAGLGLSIVSKLARLLRGEVAIESEPGRGTTIYLSLPLRLPEAKDVPAAANDKADSPPTGRNLRILLAEDDTISALACRHLLEKLGHAVATAPNGREAVERFAAEDFDLILMDIQMPVLDGIEATREIRDAGRYGDKAAIPIIAMTAFAMAGDKERFLAGGMDGYIAKPVDRDKLRQNIDHVLGQARPSPQAGRKPEDPAS